MKFALIKLMIVITIMTPILKTPISMGSLLLAYTMISTLLVSKIIVSSWMAMIMFLMFIGGLLILFMYMSSIASNEKFKPNFKVILLTMLVFLPMEEMMSENQLNDYQNMIMPMDMISLSKMYNMKTVMITIMLFLYMFLSMIMVTKIIKIYKGPLRSAKY